MTTVWHEGDRVKISLSDYNDFYGNLDWLIDMHDSKSGDDEVTFESALTSLIACSGTGTVIRPDSCNDPLVLFETTVLGVKYSHQHYFCKDNLERAI